MTKTLNVLVAAAVLAAACGGKEPAPRSAADEKAPPPPSDAQIAEAKRREAEREKAAPAPPSASPAAAKARKVAASERADFDALVKRWEEAKAAGRLDAGTAKSLASKFSSLASSHPDLAAIAHFNAGTLYDSVGEQKDAESEYQAALQANASFGPALNNLGEIYYRQGARGRAKEWFEKAIAADPKKTAAAYTNLAVILYNEAKESGNTALYKEAISKLRRALAIDNDSMAAYALLAVIYYTTAEGAESKLRLAELVCKQAKDVNDKYAPIYNTLGLIKLKRRNVTGALKEFEKAVELDPKYVEAHLNIGAIGLSSRQYEKAQKSFETVLALQPNNFDAQVGLGVALRGQRKIDEAEAAYKKAQSIDGKACSIAYNLGLLYQDYKNSEDNKHLRQAQDFYRQYVQCGKTIKAKVDDANRRIKDIDDTFVALAEQKKMAEEAAKIQAEAEKMQKEMEAQQKAQEEAAKKQGGDGAPPGKK
jgi:tetratricopeptide (TPR) repeat protein